MLVRVGHKVRSSFDRTCVNSQRVLLRRRLVTSHGELHKKEVAIESLHAPRKGEQKQSSGVSIAVVMLI